MAADRSDHLRYFFREPVIILIAKRDILSGGQPAALLEIADKSQIALVDHHPHPRIAAGILPENVDSPVAAAIVNGNDLQRRPGLRQYRSKLLMQISFAVIGAQDNRY